MSNRLISLEKWLDAFRYCSYVKESLVDKIGVSGKAVSIKVVALPAALISYNTGVHTIELYDEMCRLDG